MATRSIFLEKYERLIEIQIIQCKNINKCMMFSFQFLYKINYFLDDNGYTNVGQFYSLFWLYDVKL